MCWLGGSGFLFSDPRPLFHRQTHGGDGRQDAGARRGFLDCINTISKSHQTNRAVKRMLWRRHSRAPRWHFREPKK